MTRKKKPVRGVVIYARFSPRRNADECASCQTQIERCMAWATWKGYPVKATYRDEGLSGKDDKRPGLQQALEHVCRAKLALVVYSLSRLARNTRHAIEISERLDKAGADLVSLHEEINTTTSSGRLFFRIIAAIDEFEREIIAERTSEAMISHQARGRRMSSQCPYGWKPDPENPARMIPDKDERRAITWMRRLAKKGLSYRAIGRTLVQGGMLPRTGGTWSHSVIREILTNRQDYP